MKRASDKVFSKGQAIALHVLSIILTLVGVIGVGYYTDWKVAVFLTVALWGNNLSVSLSKTEKLSNLSG